MLKELLESAKKNSLTNELIREFEKRIDLEAVKWPKASNELLEDCRGEAMMNLVCHALKFKPQNMTTEEKAELWIYDIIRESHTNVIAKWNR